MNLETTTQHVLKRALAADALGATVKFVLEGEPGGVVYLDGRGAENTVSNADDDADCIVRVDHSEFDSMLTGETNPMAAFMSGKLKVEGDMGVAMKLTSIL
ncbi:MAG: SCP2 sterol-binding domain-containing protein [Bacteroidia bacterium]